jgi:hypothetical protein
MVDGAQMNIYRGCTPVVDFRFDRRSEDSLTHSLVHAIAEAEHTDPTELTQLYDVIDLDSLSELFGRLTDETASQSVYGFQLGNWNVFVRSDGCIRVCDATKPTAPVPVFDGFAA